MKKNFVLLVLVLLGLLFIACENILADKPELVDEGKVVSIKKVEQSFNLDTSRVTVTIDSDVYGAVVMYQASLLDLLWDNSSIGAGDKIYLYRYEHSIVISKDAIDEAKPINYYIVSN